MKIAQVHKDYIEFENGQKYFHEDYVLEMNKRNYDKGFSDGQRIEIHKVEVISFEKNKH